MTTWKDTYPRPQMVRDKWLSLDGQWTFSIKKTNEAGIPEKPTVINVPFCPESMLSGLNRITRKDELMLYGRSFTVPEEWEGMRLILHLGAVDQTARETESRTSAGNCMRQLTASLRAESPPTMTSVLYPLLIIILTSRSTLPEFSLCT